MVWPGGGRGGLDIHPSLDRTVDLAPLPPGYIQELQSMGWQYASYWNAFLLGKDSSSANVEIRFNEFLLISLGKYLFTSQ